MIDFIILICFYGILFGILFENFPNTVQQWRLQILYQFIIFQIYFFLFTWLNKGKTIGQKIIKISIISTKNFNIHKDKKEKDISDLTKPSVYQSFIHSLGKFYLLIGIDFIIGLIIKWSNPDSTYSRLFQILANTQSIKMNQNEKKN